MKVTTPPQTLHPPFQKVPILSMTIMILHDPTEWPLHIGSCLGGFELLGTLIWRKRWQDPEVIALLWLVLGGAGRPSVWACFTCLFVFQ